MEYLSSFGAIGGADGPTSIFIAGTIPEFGIVHWGIMIAIGLLIGLFGLKLMRVLAAISGLAFGGIIGLVIAGVANVSENMFLVIVLGFALLSAILFAILKRAGAFLIALGYVFGVIVTILPLEQMVTMIAATAIAVIFAILGAIYVEPIVILSTALSGGISAGAAIIEVISMTNVISLEGRSWLIYVVSAVLVLICIIVQSMMQSRKIGRKEKVFAAKYKEEESMESEVERARQMIWDEDEVETDAEAYNEGNSEIEIEEIDLEN